MANYIWGWQLPKEFKAITSDYMTQEEIDKRWYVSQYLEPSVHEARCGWDGIMYAVVDNDGKDRREYVLMFADRNDTPNGARWINVTGDSKGAIAEAVWSLVFR